MARKNEEVEHLKYMNSILRKQIDKIHETPGDLPVTGCGDNSCSVAKPSGMATNGGCRCDPRRIRIAMQYWRRRAEFLQETIRLMNEENVKNMSLSFEEAWKSKEAEGYQYGEDALEQVRFGWELAQETSHIASSASALEKAANVCEKMVVVGRAWTEEQKISADALFAAAKNIRELK